MPPTRPTPAQPARPRRAARLASADTILQAATTLFLRNGYLGTSMEDIARLAGVSKQTVYTHFADKEQLFTQLTHGNIDQVESFILVVDAFFETINGEPLATVLTRLARLYVNIVVEPRVQQLRRLVIGESGRFPALARTYYERVPQRVIGVLAAHFAQLAGRGRLQLDDPLVAAQHFAWLVVAVPLDRGMLCGEDEDMRFTSTQLDDFAATGVRVFLAAYGPAPEKSPTGS